MEMALFLLVITMKIFSWIRTPWGHDIMRSWRHNLNAYLWVYEFQEKYSSWFRILMINHYYDVVMGAMASQITSLTIVFSTVYSDADQIKHQSSPSLAFVRGIHRGPVNSPHKWPVTRKIFPFDDVIMITKSYQVRKYTAIIQLRVNW